MDSHSRAVEHAIRALTTLAAQGKGSLVMARKLAGLEGIPAPSLSKTLQQLARKGVLRSVKGRGGGFGLARSAREITVAQIIEALEGRAGLDRCSLGYKSCRPHKPCYIDQLFTATRSAVKQQLEATSLHDLVRSRRRIRTRSRKKKGLRTKRGGTEGNLHQEE